MPLDKTRRLSLSDCDTIQFELSQKTSARALAERFDCSTTLIYKVRDGKHPAQLEAESKRPDASLKQIIPEDPCLCPGCLLPTIRPCPVCAGRANAEKLSL